MRHEAGNQTLDLQLTKQEDRNEIIEKGMNDENADIRNRKNL
jgi:hypothetical protein